MASRGRASGEVQGGAVKLLVHAHTTYSHDGRLSPQDLADLARNKGFDGVLISDHYEDLDEESFRRLVRDCEAIDTCVLVPGYEKDWSGFHLCAFGVNHWIVDEEIASWSTKVREAGGIVCLAHPGRYKHRVPAGILAVCDAVEIWNSKRPYDGFLGPHPDAYALLGNRLALVGQDLHRTRDATTLGIITLGGSSSSDIITAIRQRRYRSTSRVFTFRAPPVAVRGILRLLHPVRRWMWFPLVKTYRILRKLRIAARTARS